MFFSFQSPGRALRPVAKSVCSPSRRLVLVARGARIRDFVLIGHGGGDELKRVAVHFDVGYRSLDRWHVARHAIASNAAGFVVRVFFDGSGVRSVR